MLISAVEVVGYVAVSAAAAHQDELELTRAARNFLTRIPKLYPPAAVHPSGLHSRRPVAARG